MDFIPQAATAAFNFGANGGLAAIAPDVLSSGATALTAFSMLSAGLADRNEAYAAADRERLGARQELIRGRQSGNEILDRMIDTLARNRVIAAASGTSANIGTPAAVARDIQRRGERAIGIEGDNAAIEWFTRNQAAGAMRRRGRAYGLGGLIQAGGQLAEGALREKWRGGPED